MLKYFYGGFIKMIGYNDKLQELLEFKGMEVPDDIPQGDMPRDPVWIGPEVIEKANTLFPLIVKELMNIEGKAVISVAGGSGVGKTCIASLFAYYLNANGIKAYTMSGDNYPRRIPEYNDAERLHIYRESATKGLVRSGDYTIEHMDILRYLQEHHLDSDPKQFAEYPWMESYFEAGKAGLKGYLGTGNEIRFEEVDDVLKQFKDGQEKIWLKRMGRSETSLWYEEKDFSDTQVIVLEWTHGLSYELNHVDIPILLNSTPEETLERRKARGRDANTDTPFIAMVLAIEQRKLHSQAPQAKFILSKAGKIITLEEYKEAMKELDD